MTPPNATATSRQAPVGGYAAPTADPTGSLPAGRPIGARTVLPAAVPGDGWERRVRSTTVPIVVGAVGLAALGTVQLIPNRISMEHQLTNASQSALRAAGIDGLTVTFSGRDAVLHGQIRVPGTALRALTVVRGVDGVRVVRSDLTPGGSSSPTTAPVRRVQPRELIATVASGTVTLTGSVPNARARAALVAAASEVFGPGAVLDQLTVEPGAAAPDAPALTELLTAFGAQTTGAIIDLSGNRLTLTGTVPSPQAHTAVIEAATRFGGNAGRIVDQLSIAPTVSADELQKSLDALATITFRASSTTLTLHSKAVVRRAARVLLDGPDFRISIQGHTDNQGSHATSLPLSEARAEAVRDRLVALGVDPARLLTAGLGESKPLAANDTPEHRSLNRRVDLVVLP